MKRTYGIALAMTATTVSAGGWLGCSSGSSGSPDGGGTTTSSTTTSSSGATTSSATTSSSNGSGDGGSLTWGGPSGVYAQVIAAHCIPCHTAAVPLADGGTRVGGGLRVGMLDFSSVDAGYANVIDMPAMGNAVPATDWQDAAVCDTLEAGAPGSKRVVPGSATSSLLCLKVNGFTAKPPCGAPMPEPTPGPGEIDSGIGQNGAFTMIRDWINQGALP